MDSVTQLTLGAAVGEAVLGRKLGNRAIVLGAVFGTVPDLDVVLSPFWTQIEFLEYHRGLSHSILATLVVSPLLACGFLRLSKRSARPGKQSQSSVSFRRWLWFFLIVFATHILIDCLTLYGTQIFAPFDDTRIAVLSIFVIDPLYTIPLLACVIACLVMNRRDRRRRRVNAIGLSISTAYLVLTLVNKVYVDSVFDEALAAQGIKPKRVMTVPTPLNNVLWYCAAEVDGGYHLGFYSILDSSQEVKFVYRERKNSLLGDLADTHEIDRLIWFADGYYTIRQHKDGLLFNALNFGTFDVQGRTELYPFTYLVKQQANPGVQVSRYRSPNQPPTGELASRIWQRLKGQ